MTSTIPYDPFPEEEDNNPFSQHEREQEIQQESTPVQQDVDDNQPHSENVVNTDDHSKKEETKIAMKERINNKLKIVIKVTDVERIGKMAEKRENPIVVFDVSTNVRTFRSSTYKKRRKSYDEFKQIFKFLKGELIESFIPTLPIQYTNFGIINTEDHDKMIKNFQEWFDRVTMDPLVVRNQEFAYFIESDFGTYVPINKPTGQITGLKRRTLKQLAPPYDSVTDLAEFRPLVKSIYLLCQDIQEKLLRSNKTKKAMVRQEHAFGQGFIQLDEHNNLYKRFGKMLKAIGDVDSIIATMDMATLYDGIQWIVTDTYMIKEASFDR